MVAEFSIWPHQYVKRWVTLRRVLGLVFRMAPRGYAPASLEVLLRMVCLPSCVGLAFELAPSLAYQIESRQHKYDLFVNALALGIRTHEAVRQSHRRADS